MYVQISDFLIMETSISSDDFKWIWFLLSFFFLIIMTLFKLYLKTIFKFVSLLFIPNTSIHTHWFFKQQPSTLNNRFKLNTIFRQRIDNPNLYFSTLNFKIVCTNFLWLINGKSDNSIFRKWVFSIWIYKYLKIQRVNSYHLRIQEEGILNLKPG